MEEVDLARFTTDEAIMDDVMSAEVAAAAAARARSELELEVDEAMPTETCPPRLKRGRWGSCGCGLRSPRGDDRASSGAAAMTQGVPLKGGSQSLSTEVSFESSISIRSHFCNRNSAL